MKPSLAVLPLLAGCEIRREEAPAAPPSGTAASPVAAPSTTGGVVREYVGATPVTAGPTPTPEAVRACADRFMAEASRSPLGAMEGRALESVLVDYDLTALPPAAAEQFIAANRSATNHVETLASGPAGLTRDRFMRGEAVADTQVLRGDGVLMMRLVSHPASMRAGVEQGCARTPPGGRIVTTRFAWGARR